MTGDSAAVRASGGRVLDTLGHFASPAAARNALPLVEALYPLVPKTGCVLEVASGTGFHAAVLAACFPQVEWQPTEADHQRLPGIQQLVQESGLANLLAPQHLDATTTTWPVETIDAVLCLNMIHIAPWAVAEGLMRGVSRVLNQDAHLFLYGPFKVEGQHTAPSNAAFDDSLRLQNPAWGVRDTVDVDGLAESSGLLLDQTIIMPANNMIRVYRKRV